MSAPHGKKVAHGTRGAGGRPRTIVVRREMHNLWRFEVLNENGACIDYSLTSRMGLAWRMARRSWRHAAKKVGS